MYPFALILGLVVGVVVAEVSIGLGQASDFPVSAEVAQQHSCGQACQSLLNQTIPASLEIFGTNFDFDFYETARNFSSSKPGDLLKLQAVDPSTINVAGGVAVYKIQYTSTDLDGSILPATGFVAIPFVSHCKPFKVVAYAHGTTGLFRGCAPSTSPFLTDYTSWTPLVLSGYAVVATDYAGLGNNYTLHKYLSAANANDVYWSVVAASKAFPGRLSSRWASIGHSQGGQATWKLSEHPLVQGPSSGYLGGVSIAPSTKLYDAAIQSFEMLQELPEEEIQKFGVIGLVSYTAVAIQRVFPNYTAPFLASTMRNRIKLAELGQFCDIPLSGLTNDLSLEDLVAPEADFSKDKIFQEFQRLNAPAQGDSASKPLLVIQGRNDTIVLEDMTISAYNSSCEAGNSVQLSLYPGLDHTAVMHAAAPEWLSFLHGLFSDESISAACRLTIVSPFDLEHAQAPLDEF